MSTKNKIISVLCVLAMLFTTFMATSVTVFAATYDTPLESQYWEEPNFSTDHAYSFAFVGDTQYLTCGDYYLGTDKMSRLYGYIADTATERKLEHVFILGDITDLGYKNDLNLAAGDAEKTGYGEWNIASEAIYKLNDAGVSYSVTRGNHDDYAIDKFFNISKYTDQFSTGGFYSDSNAKWKDAKAGSNSWNVTRVIRNYNGYVYWNGVENTHHTSSIVNSWKTVEICDTKYLFITIDFNPTDNVLNWVDEILAAYPDHKAIITTHSYLSSDGNAAESDDGATMYLFGNPGKVLWEEVLSKHENVFMVVSGHVGSNNIFYTYNEGVNGNKVLQVLVDPQNYDAKETDTNGTIEHGTQDTGLVLYMNFSEDGKTITFDYYSTLFGKMKKNNNYTIKVDSDDATVTEGDVNLSCLDAYGQKNTYITHQTAVAPTLDGTVNSTEYSFKRTTTAAEAGYNYESDLNEYFSHDDDYVYYAFSIKQSRLEFSSLNAEGETVYSPFSYQFNFKPNYEWVEYDTLVDEHYPRIQVNFSIDSEGTITKKGNASITTASQVRLNIAAPKWDEDVFISATRDGEGVNTFELKISKKYFARNQYPDLNSLAYVLYLGYDPSQSEALVSKQLWHRWDSTSSAIAAMKADGYSGTGIWMYEYMVFTSTMNTHETASARIRNDGYYGLRFKTEVGTDLIDRYINTYGEENVTVGTLIAPTDLLDGQTLTHSVGTNGVDYVDVEAKIDAPFESKDGVNVYSGSIVNIAQKNLDRDFTAVGYIKYVDEGGKTQYYYSTTSAQRNVEYVAILAFGDVSKTSKTGYTNLVSDVNDSMYGKYSPYTAAQRRILVLLMVDRTLSDPSYPDPFS